VPRRPLQNLLRLALGLALLAWIASQIELAQLLELMRLGDARILGLGVGLLVFAMLGLQWMRLHLLIRGYTASLATSLKIFYVGALFNNFLPSNLGGDAMRLWYLQELRRENVGTPFMLLLVYRFSSFAVLVAAGALYLLLDAPRLFALLRAHEGALQPSLATWSVAAALAIAAIVAGIALRKRVSQRVRSGLEGFLLGCRAALAQLSAADIAWLGAQTIAFHLCRALSFYCLVRYMGQHAALWDLVFVISATALFAVLPITVAGFGVIEASITGLLGLFGVDVSCAAAVALVNRAVLLLAAAVGGVIYLRGSGLASPSKSSA
jgi:uncharacterized protein (TIRG00374 family)